MCIMVGRIEMFYRGLNMTFKRLKTIFIIFMVIMILFACVAPEIGLDANTTVTVDLRSDSTNVEPGDMITIDVAVSHFPNLTRFGPIEIHFDASSVSYMGMSVGEGMPSTFDINSTASAGVVAVSGIDQTVESQIEENQGLPEVDEEGEPLPLPEDPSMHSDGRLVLLSLRFEVLDSAREDVRFWISNIAGFRNSSGESVMATIGEYVTIPIRTTVSSDASLGALAIDGFNIEPTFSPNIFEYRATVPRTVTNLIVDASPSDVASQVIISGQNGLQVGENEVLITVIAQDRITSEEYRIIVDRQDSRIPEGAYINGTDGNSYYFLDIPEDLSIPSGFYEGSFKHENFDAPAFIMDGLREILLYLQGPDDFPRLYIYSRETGSLVAFDSMNSFFRMSQLLTLVPLEDQELIPEGFSEKTFVFRNREVTGYESDDGRHRLLYMIDETGDSRFFVADTQNNDLYPFVAPKQQPSTGVFIVLFVIFLCLAIVEAIMIGIIIYQVRKRRPVTPPIRRV